MASWVSYSLIGKVVLKTLSPLVSVSYAAVIGTLALAFVVRQVVLVRQGEKINGPKILFLVAVVPLHVYVCFSPAILTASLLAFSAFITIFHDIQYHAIVWFHHRNRYHRPGVDPKRYGLAPKISRNLLTYFGIAIFFAIVVPVVIGQPFLRLFLLAEHGRCAHVANMFANTRTTFTNRAVRWLAWNMPYHAEHHAIPSAPFHKLPALHALARDHLRENAPGYAAFNCAYVDSFADVPNAAKPRNQRDTPVTHD